MEQVSTIEPGHSGSIHTIKFNSSASYILSAGHDRKIQLTNVETGAHIKSYQLHAYDVVDLCISQDSSKFASCGGKTVYLWNVSTGNTIQRFNGHLAQVNSISFNFNESVLASASNDSTVKLWDLKSNVHSENSKWENGTSIKPIMALADAKDGVSDVEMHGYKIVTVSFDGKLRVYDLRMGKLITDTVGVESGTDNTASTNNSSPRANSNTPLTSISISQDGDTALISSLDSTIRLMDLESGLSLQTYHGHSNKTFRLKSLFYSNDEHLASPSEDGYLYLWNLMDEKFKHRIQVGPSNVPIAYDVATVDEQVKIVAGSFQSVQLFNLN